MSSRSIRFILLRICAAAGLLCASCPGSAFAELTMTLRGRPGQSLLFFELTGSAVVPNFTGAIAGVDGRLPNFDAFRPIMGASHFPLVSGGGSVTNVSKSLSSAIMSMFLQDALSRPAMLDRFGVNTLPYLISAGDTMAWSGSGTIDLSSQGVAFEDLTVGSGIAEMIGPFPETAGRLVIQQVPEPRSLALLPLAAIVMTELRRTRRVLSGASRETKGG